jgi:hypothetical protein
MVVRHLLDLAGVHVLPAREDHVLLPVDDVEVAVGVLASEVAAVEPAVTERACELAETVREAAHVRVELPVVPRAVLEGQRGHVRGALRGERQHSEILIDPLR